MTGPSFPPLRSGPVEPLWFLGDQVIDLKLTGADTNGAFTLLEVVTEAGGGAPSPHVHAHEDETLWLLEGEVVVTVGGTERTVRPGDVVFFPRAVPHSFENRGPARSRGVGVITPAGLEAFFRALGVPKAEAERPRSWVEPSVEALAAAAAAVGMTLL